MVKVWLFDSEAAATATKVDIEARAEPDDGTLLVEENKTDGRFVVMKKKPGKGIFILTEDGMFVPYSLDKIIEIRADLSKFNR